MKPAMSRLAFACLGALCSSPVIAADLRGTFAPEAPTNVPPFSWTGLYIGAHGGYAAMSDDAWTQNTVSRTASRLHRETDGALGGGQIGYNYQVGNSGVVLGLEGDASWVGLSANHLDLTVSKTQDFETTKTDIDLLATVRGRLGYAIGPALFYATGGLAIRDGEATRTQYYTPTFNVPFSSKPTYVDKVSNTSIGYTVGGGIEYAFAAHLSLKAEYEYMHFEDIGATFPRALRVVDSPTDFQPRHYSSDENIHLAKVGINYHF